MHLNSMATKYMGTSLNWYNVFLLYLCLIIPVYLIYTGVYSIRHFYSSRSLENCTQFSLEWWRFLLNPDVKRSRNCFQVEIQSHFSTTTLSLFELKLRLDNNFSIQDVGQVDDQVKTVDHIVFQISRIWIFRYILRLNSKYKYINLLY